MVILDLEPAAVHYVAPTTNRDGWPRWSPDGSQLAFVRRPGQEARRPLIPEQTIPWSIWVADTKTAAARQVWQSSSDRNGSLPIFLAVSFNFAADNYITFSSEQTGRNHLYSISSSGGNAMELTPGDFDVEDVTLSADRRSLLYSSNQDDVDRRHIWRVRIAGGQRQEALTRGETIEWAPVETGDGSAVVSLGSSATTPAQVFRLSRGGRQVIAGNALPADFPSAQLVVPKQVIFESSDGYTIHGQLFVPRNVGKSAPAVIFTHGGPIRQMLLGFHYMDYYHYSYAVNQYLASRGYVVLSVNYRLGIMYGRAFREAPHTVWRGAAEYNDVLAGASYLKSLPYVDARRIGLWGGSYGGFLTALGLARNSDLFAAGVDYFGVHDWRAFLPLWEGASASEAPDGKQAAELAFSSSPVSSLDKWKSPVLLIHGDDDRNVPFDQTTDLAARLSEHGVDFEEMIIPDEIHGFLLWKDMIPSYEAMVKFFDRKLKSATR